MTVEGEGKVERKGEEGKDKQRSFSEERRLKRTRNITRLSQWGKKRRITTTRLSPVCEQYVQVLTANQIRQCLLKCKQQQLHCSLL